MKPFQGIDLSSDTATRPTLAMKKAMLAAPVGDEQKAEDPTTRQLEEKVADLLGLEAAMFFPSATMANEVALRLLCEPGDELIAAATCHLFFAEAGGPAVHAGLLAKPIYVSSGIFTADELRATCHQLLGPHYPVPKCVSIENTSNVGGGLAWDLKNLRQVIQAARELKMKAHLDGARLFNAAVKTKVKPAAIASQFDTATLCLSKGLGCPVGAVLAFPKADYSKVRRLKQLFGGAMRQSGMLAAAGLYGLEHHVTRLEKDHENAATFAKKLMNTFDGMRVEYQENSTNMVFFEWRHKKISPIQFQEACLKKGLRFSRMGENRFRAVFHLDVTRKDVVSAIKILQMIA